MSDPSHQINLVQDNELGCYQSQVIGIDATTARQLMGATSFPVTLEITEQDEGRMKITYAGPCDGMAEAMIHVARLREAKRKKFELPRVEELVVLIGASLLLCFFSYWVVSAWASLQTPSYQQPESLGNHK